MMKKLFLATLVFAGAWGSTSYASTENNKVLMFIDPSDPIAMIVIELMQFWSVHPKVDAHLVTKELTEDEQEEFLGRWDSKNEEARMDAIVDQWDAQAAKIKKAGIYGEMESFMQDYYNFELKNLTEIEQEESSFNAVVDSGNRLAQKFKVKRYPELVIVDSESKRVTRYPLPSRLYDGVKKLDYLLKYSPEELGVEPQEAE